MGKVIVSLVVFVFVVFFTWCTFKTFAKKDKRKENTTYNGVLGNKENNINSQR